MLPQQLNISYRNWTRLGLPDRDALAVVDPGGWITPFAGGPSVAVWIGDARRMWTLGPLPGWGEDEHVRLRQQRLDAGPFVRTTAERQDVRVQVDVFPALVQGQVVFGITARVHQRAPAARPVRLAFSIRAANPEGPSPIGELVRQDDGWWTADGRPILFVPRPGHEVRLASWDAGDAYAMVGGRLREGSIRTPSDARTRVVCPRGQATGVEVYRMNLAASESFKRTVWCAPSMDAAPVLRRASASQLYAGARADWKGVLKSGARFEPAAHGRLLEAARSTLLASVGSAKFASEDAAVGIAALGRLGHLRRAARILRGLEIHDGALLLAAVDHVGLSGDKALLRELWPTLLRATRPLQEQGATIASVAGLRAASVAARWLGEGADERRLGLIAGRLLETLRLEMRERNDLEVLGAVWPAGLLSATEEPVRRAVAKLERRAHRAGVFDDALGGIHVARTCWLGQIALAAGEPGAPRRLDYLAEHAFDTGAWPAAFHPHRGGVAGSGDDVGSAAEVALLCRNLVAHETGDTLHLFRGVDRRWYDGETICEGLPTRFGPIDLHARGDHLRLDGRWRRRPRIVWHKPDGVSARLVVGDREVEGSGPELTAG